MAGLTPWPASACRRHRDDAKYILRDKRIDRPGEIVLRRRAVSRIALVLCAAGLAVAVAGCKNSLQLFQDNNEGGWFSKPVDIFRKPDWAVASSGDQSDAAQSAAGRSLPRIWSAPTAAARAAAAPRRRHRRPPPRRPAARPAGRLHGRRSRPRADARGHARLRQSSRRPAPPRVLGGVALGMSECEVVRRAGLPGNVNIGAGDRGEPQGRAHLSQRPLARHLHLQRRPAEGRRRAPPRRRHRRPNRRKPRKPRPRKSRRNRKPPPARSTALTCSNPNTADVRRSRAPRWRRAIPLPPWQSPPRPARGFLQARRRAPDRARTARRRRAWCRACASWRVSCAITTSACEMRLRNGAVSARLSAAARRTSPGSDARRRFRADRISPAAVGEHHAAVIVEIAVERRDLAAGDQPQPVGAGFQADSGRATPGSPRRDNR